MAKPPKPKPKKKKDPNRIEATILTDEQVEQERRKGVPVFTVVSEEEQAARRKEVHDWFAGRARKRSEDAFYRAERKRK